MKRLVLAALCALAVRSAFAGDILLMGDSYMVGMSPYFHALWPDADVRAKVGAGIGAPMWSELRRTAGYEYVFISLGTNDQPSPEALGERWAVGYAGKVSALLRAFPEDVSIHWIVPPCPVGVAPDDVSVARWQWLVFAIKRGIDESGRRARIAPVAQVCDQKARDGLHFSGRGYKQMVAASIQ